MQLTTLDIVIIIVYAIGLFALAQWVSRGHGQRKDSTDYFLASTIGSFALSVAIKALWPELPFMDRMALVFVLALLLAIVCSLVWPATALANRIQTGGIGFLRSAGFNIGASGVIVILIALYTAWW
jgi:hypothetical protein